MIKKLTLVSMFGVALATTTLMACNSPSKSTNEEIVIRKMDDDTIWVKDTEGDTETVVSYKVKHNYYTVVEVGDQFNDTAVVGEGTEEYSFTK